MKSGTKFLNEFNNEIDAMYFFWKRNNIDMVNSIIDEIEMNFDSIFIHSLYLSNYNYPIYDKKFTEYIHNVDLKYTMWKIFE